MTRAREKVTFTLQTIIRYVILKKVLLGMVCLFFYLSPTIFVTGFLPWMVLVILGTDLLIDIVYSFVVFGLVGVEKETAIPSQKRKRRWRP